VSDVAGILVIDKPAGWTSFDVVGFVRRRSGVKRVGHAGTLDPAATGVLTLLMGTATRLTEYLVGAGKAYRATVELGVETDTYDRDGTVIAEQDASGVTRAQVDAALAQFRGEIWQVPPVYSAIKRGGEASYKAARRGDDVTMEPRRVRVDDIAVVSYEPPFLVLDVTCGKGFYVRSLAHDVGATLGVGATLAALRRTRVGSFDVAGAVDMEALRGELEDGTWQRRLWAPDEVLLGLRAAVLGDANRGRLLHGLDPRIEAGGAPDERCRAYDATGEFLAVLRREGERWRPDKVFASAP
jgi:tRNA pseudouridine55 synthase